MNGRFLLSTLGLCGIFLTGCTVYDPNLLPGSGGWQPGTPPPKPPDTTSDPTDTGSISFAFASVVLNQGADWRTIGFNMDGWNTTVDNDYRGDCTPWAADGDPIDYAPDGDYGIDNRFGERLWPVMQQTLPSLDCEINEAFQSGHGTLIMRLQKWNGTDTDAEVVVELAPAVDGTADAITNCNSFVGEEVQFGGSDAAAPGWAGSDRFCINPLGIVAASGEATVRDPLAYITDGQLVVTLRAGAEFVLMSTRSSVRIELNQGVILATLNQTLDAIESGFVSGRFAIADLLDVGPEIGSCDPDALYDTYRSFADILATAAPGATGTAECDAISIGVAFTATEATWLGVAPNIVDPKEACDPAIMAAYPYPVEACCAELSPAEGAACDAYWNP